MYVFDRRIKNIEIKSVRGTPPPMRALRIVCRIEMWRGRSAIVTGVNGYLTYKGQLITDRLLVEDPQRDHACELALDLESTTELVLLFPVSREAVLYMENDRLSDVSVGVKLQFCYQCELRKNEESRSTVLWESEEVSYFIPQSEWVKRLSEMKWEYSEIVEMPQQPLVQDERTEEALKLLSEANAFLQLRSYKDVIIKCRAALESAAKYHSEGDTKAGFSLLLNRAFKDTSPKKERIDELIRALSEYAHLARHEDYPALHFLREESEFVYATTVALFSMIGRSISREEST